MIKRKVSSSRGTVCQYGCLSTPGLIVEVTMEGSVSEGLRFVL